MTTLIVKPKNKKELSNAKKMLKVLNISFEDNDDKPYKEEFVEQILKSKEQYKAEQFTSIVTEDLWK